MWLNGPEFLTKAEDLWPRDPSYHQMELSTDDPELKRDVQIHSQSALLQPAEDFLTKLFHQFSSFDKLRKAFAWLLRFKNRFVRRHRRRLVNSSPSISQTFQGELSVDEVQGAERGIIRHLQKLSFSKVIEALQRVIRNQESSHQVKSELRKLKTTTSLSKLSPVLDCEGILRVGGRLENAAISYDAKHQIILPYRSLLTVMAEVQGILNSRPLTPVSNDPRDLEPLSPNHLFLLRANPNLPPGIFSKEDNYCKRRMRQVQYVSVIFWKRWLKKYLPTLQLSLKWFNPRRCFAVNDFVLVMEAFIEANGLWPELFKFIAKGMDTSDL